MSDINLGSAAIGALKLGSVDVTRVYLGSVLAWEAVEGFIPYLAMSNYSGNGSTKAIVTGQDMATTGGLIWTKRTNAANYNWLVDTIRGNEKALATAGLAEQGMNPGSLTFNDDGHTWNSGNAVWNDSSGTYVSWSWLIQSGYFDIKKYTGNGTAGRILAHDLGVAPSMVWIKNLTEVDNFYLRWAIGHKSMADSQILSFNLNAAPLSNSAFNIVRNSANIALGDSAYINGSTDDYIAYMFADKAGWSKADGYAGSGATGKAVTGLGFQPDTILIKRYDSTGDWYLIYDDGGIKAINPNNQNAPSAISVTFDSDGFTINTTGADLNASGGSYMYMAWKKAVPSAGTITGLHIEIDHANWTRISDLAVTVGSSTDDLIGNGIVCHHNSTSGQSVTSLAALSAGQYGTSSTYDAGDKLFDDAVWNDGTTNAGSNTHWSSATANNNIYIKFASAVALRDVRLRFASMSTYGNPQSGVIFRDQDGTIITPTTAPANDADVYHTYAAGADLAYQWYFNGAS